MPAPPGLGLPWRSLLLAGLAAGLFLAAGPAPDLWVYARQGLAEGQLWRLLSGHLVHSDPAHLGWDLGALLLLGWAFEPLLRERFWPLLGVAALVIDAGLWFGLPGLARYCGLSGLLNALLAAGLWRLWRGHGRHPLMPVIGLLSLLKPLWELGAGQALFTSTFWPSLPEAHLLGLAAGFGFALWIWPETAGVRIGRGWGKATGAALPPPKPPPGVAKGRSRA
jgi:rhomboid family GlyGly-CTERM serine protease